MNAPLTPHMNAPPVPIAKTGTHCTACGQPSTSAAKFCGSCGASMFAQTDTRPRRAQRDAPARSQGSAAGQAAFRELVNLKWARARRLRWIGRIMLFAIVLVCGAGLASGDNRSDTFLFVGFLPFFLFLGSLTRVPEPRLTVDEYRHLPGALNDRGQHQCLQCGHSGIYRRTPYKSSDVLANCAKCEAPLWKAPVDA